MASYPPRKCCTIGVKHEGEATGTLKDMAGTDQYAANGYLTLMPDLFNGDAIPVDRPEGFDMESWRKKHSFEHVDPIVERMIRELKGSFKMERIGGVGYCFGAKYVSRFLTKKGGLEAGYVAHPSWVTAKEVEGIEGPLSIAAAETDGVFPPEKRHETEIILRESGNPYQITLYSGVSHGFAVRGDLSNKQVLFAKEQAFYQAIAWFDEYIKK
ncbi:Dienelactone hydrolase [Venturia nashicola]|nr:Dienelactone hydrolase [Venturia nashicola]